jgi:hypothetical protein
MYATKIDFSKCNAKRVKRETLLVSFPEKVDSCTFVVTSA